MGSGSRTTATLKAAPTWSRITPKLGEQEREQIRLALCSTRGRYLAVRAS